MKTWNPSDSPLCIEYAEELLQELAPDPARLETTGLLYGRREGGVLKLSSLEPDADALGIYVLRLRGEVFLTEANLNLFVNSRSSLALVIAGDKAGFFVHGYDGSLQAVRSYEEFSVPRRARARSKAMYVAGLALLATLPIAALGYMHRPQASGLSIRENRNELIISWKPGRSGRVQISDGGLQTTIPVSSNQSSARYVRQRGGDVKVILTLIKPAQ